MNEKFNQMANKIEEEYYDLEFMSQILQMDENEIEDELSNYDYSFGFNKAQFDRAVNEIEKRR